MYEVQYVHTTQLVEYSGFFMEKSLSFIFTKGSFEVNLMGQVFYEIIKVNVFTGRHNTV